MKPLIALAACGLAGLGAHAEPCTTAQFDEAHGEAYLEAETALTKKNAPQSALELTDTLWAADLNCYERQAVRKLRAATYVELEEYASAIDLLKPLAADESLPKAERARHAYNIGQLYGALNNAEAGKPYLALSEELKAGAAEE